MKDENYVISKIKGILKNKDLVNSGYVNVFYALYLDHFNFSYADKNWINKDRIFCENKEVFEAFNKYIKIEKNTFYNLPLSVAAGQALGSKKLKKFITSENKKANIINYNTYLVCDYESLKTGDYLSTLTYIKNKDVDNLMIIAINNDEVDEELNAFYEDFNFSVQVVKSNKGKLISDAIKTAKKSKSSSLIIVNNNNEFDPEGKLADDFDFVEEIKYRTNAVYKKWLLEYDKIINDRHESILDIINYLKNPKLGIDLENIEFKLDANYENTIINSSEKIFGILKNKSIYISKVDIKNERLASSIAMGLTLSGLRPTVTLKNFSKVADIIDLAVENEIPVNYLLFNTNEDVYVKNLNVFKPSDMHEVIGSWSCTVKQNKTSLIILSDKETTLVINTNIKYVKYGAYMIKKESNVLSGVIVASGEDLKLALGVAGLLEKEDIFTRVVTMPCANLLLKQVKYEKELLPKVVKTFVIDKNTSIINNKFTSNSDCLINSNLGLDKIKEQIKLELGL